MSRYAGARLAIQQRDYDGRDNPQPHAHQKTG